MADFQKLGLDRLTNNISKAIGGSTAFGVGGVPALTVGDITTGDIVEVEMDGTAGPSTYVVNTKERRTGAILLRSTCGVPMESTPELADTGGGGLGTLTVHYTGSPTGSTFWWVF
jgi:hypothetical protein